MGKHRASRLSGYPRLGSRSLRFGLRTGWIRELSADSYAPGYEPAQAGDGDLATIGTRSLSVPRQVTRMSWSLISASRHVEGLLHVPRQDSPNGRVKDFEVRVSDDGKSWSASCRQGAMDQ